MTPAAPVSEQPALAGSTLLSVVMPAYRLAAVIAANIRRADSALSAAGVPHELVPVDDGSADGTAEAISAVAAEFSAAGRPDAIRPVLLPANVGKGDALRAGFRASRGDLVMLLDGDLDLAPEMAPAFLDEMRRSGADIVIGSKRHPQSVIDYPLFRRVASRVYYGLVRVLTGLPVTDTQVGMKLFRREALQFAFDRMLVKRFAFDVELLAIAHDAGYKIAEAPVKLEFGSKFGALSLGNVRTVLTDTLAIFYRLRLMRYYQNVRLAEMPDPPPRVSVVIACPGDSAYLREALDGIAAQTFPPLETIVLPDGPISAPGGPGVVPASADATKRVPPDNDCADATKRVPPDNDCADATGGPGVVPASADATPGGPGVVPASADATKRVPPGNDCADATKRVPPGNDCADATKRVPPDNDCADATPGGPGVVPASADATKRVPPDNDCADATKRVPPIRVIPTGKVRPAEKRNIGIREARGDIVAFLDDDAAPEPQWLAQAVRHFSRPEVGATGGPAVTPPSDPRLARLGGDVFASPVVSGPARFRYFPERFRTVDDMPSCNLLVRTSLLREIGGYSTRYWPGEDTILCLDIVRRGQEIVYDPFATVRHHRRPLFGPHLRQVGRYALHRGFFARRFPETSLRLSYMVPSLFVVGVAAGAALSCAFPALLPFYLGALAIYGAATLLASFHRNPLDWLLVWLGTILTHFWYGVRFMQGLLFGRMPKEVRAFDHGGGNAN